MTVYKLEVRRVKMEQEKLPPLVRVKRKVQNNAEVTAGHGQFDELQSPPRRMVPQKKGGPKVTIILTRNLVNKSKLYSSTVSANEFLLSPQWTYRALGKTKTASVVQTLLNRQLGLPFFTRSEESVSNSFNETKIGRQLVRTRAAEDCGRKPIKPMRVKVKQKRSKTPKTLAKVTTDWVKLEGFVPDRTEVDIVDNRLWIRSKQNLGIYARFSEKFYSLEPFNFETTRIGRADSIGKLKKVAVVKIRTLNSDPNATYLITLSEPYYLRAYDMNKRKVSNQIQLSLNILPGVKGYTSLDVCDHAAKIFIMATAEKKRLIRAILILDYPPNWTQVGIIYVDDLPLKLIVDSGLCYIIQGWFLHLSTWPLLIDKVEPLPHPTGKSPAPSLSVTFEGRLKEMSRLINTIRLHNDEFGIQNAGVPLIYAAVRNGLNFFLPVRVGPQPPVYEFQSGMGGEDFIEVFPFPDHTPRAMVCTHFSGLYEVVEFSIREAAGNNKKVKTKTSHPFNYLDEVKARRRRAIKAANDAAAAVASKPRPRRTCVKNDQDKKALLSQEKKSVLGISYSYTLNLIAVLLAGEEEIFVVLYEPRTLSMFKALPPVHAWPPEGHEEESSKKREMILNVDFGFEADFILVCIEYSKECKPSREVYCFRLMSESDAWTE